MIWPWLKGAGNRSLKAPFLLLKLYYVARVNATHILIFQSIIVNKNLDLVLNGFSICIRVSYKNKGAEKWLISLI